MIPAATGRQRASRIPLDYFKNPSVWERRKWFVTVIAVAAAAAWWTAGMLLGRQNTALHSPGALASVHHTWEANCTACHADFHPIRDDAVAVMWENGTPEADEKCQSCHRGAEHHAAKSGSFMPGCSSCHQDHQGMQASLLRMDDSACTRCHGAIDQHAASKPTLAADSMKVLRFDREHHPQFASARKDPGHLKFSHFRHLTSGLVIDPRDATTVLTLAKIPDPEQRERYRRPGQGDDAAVQLDCASCHRLDGFDFGTSRASNVVQAGLPPRPNGRYMLPITYENECQACHPLYKVAGVVQHRQTPSEIAAALQREFAKEALLGDPELLRRFIPPESLPNQRTVENETIAQGIRRNTEIAEEKFSQQYCGKCHEFKSSGPGLQPIVSPQVPAVWFLHARFDHKAHRAIDCRECHAAAYPDSPNASRESKDVLIPQRDVCLKCHSPRTELGSATSGGARFDCVECHRYHNGTEPLAGTAARAEEPVRKLSQEEFETGKRQE